MGNTLLLVWPRDIAQVLKVPDLNGRRDEWKSLLLSALTIKENPCCLMATAG